MTSQLPLRSAVETFWRFFDPSKNIERRGWKAEQEFLPACVFVRAVVSEEVRGQIDLCLVPDSPRACSGLIHRKAEQGPNRKNNTSGQYGTREIGSESISR